LYTVYREVLVKRCKERERQEGKGRGKGRGIKREGKRRKGKKRQFLYAIVYYGS